MKDVELIGVGVIPADCYLEPAVSASRKIIERFGHGAAIEIAGSNSRGKNPFPKEWRMHAFTIDALPLLNEFEPIPIKETSVPAHQHLVDTLRASEEKVTLVFVGPLTDLARALELAPDIEEKIEKLAWMGGTFLGKGNVEEPEHDGTAEWNAFWDPEAVQTVWNSSIKIDLVALESTNMVPLTTAIRTKWARQRANIGIDFLGQAYAIVPPLVHLHTNSTYFLWDVLTTATIGIMDSMKQKTVYSIVHATGISQGRTEESSDGRPVNLVYEADSEVFFDYLTDLAKQK